jgi:hypothetical protein
MEAFCIFRAVSAADMANNRAWLSISAAGSHGFPRDEREIGGRATRCVDRPHHPSNPLVKTDMVVLFRDRASSAQMTYWYRRIRSGTDGVPEFNGQRGNSRPTILRRDFGPMPPETSWRHRKHNIPRMTKSGWRWSPARPN